MERFGFIRVAAASPRLKVADVDFNAGEICSFIDEACAEGVSILVFPELSLSGSTCGDLFGQTLLLDAVERGLEGICSFCSGKDITVVIGAPLRHAGRLYDCAVVIRDGEVEGIVPKSYPDAAQSRWFSSGQDMDDDNFSAYQVFKTGEAVFSIEIGDELLAPVPPSSCQAIAGAHIILNPSSVTDVVTGYSRRRDLILAHSARLNAAYVFRSSGYGESTQDGVFSGGALVVENGRLLKEGERFRTEGHMVTADVDVDMLAALRRKNTMFDIEGCCEYETISLGDPSETDFEASLRRKVEPHPFVPEGSDLDFRAREIISIQVTGLMTRLEHVRPETAVLGISGGLDSTLALIVTCLAFDRLGWGREKIRAVTMPGFGTTDRTYRNAVDLMAGLGVTSREISIVPSVTQHFKDIGQDMSVHDVAYENAQARERTQILMDIGNMENGLVVGTGDLSELALGWATYNGDHMSMYGVNAGVPKTLVKYLVKWAALNRFDSNEKVRDILLDITDTPISPELTPGDEQGNILQKTEDLVGPYELHDFFLYNFSRNGFTPDKIFFLARKAFEGVYEEEVIRKWLRKFCWRFFSQQFKRSCMPDGPKVGSVSLSPRGAWAMPSDASVNVWIDNIS